LCMCLAIDRGLGRAVGGRLCRIGRMVVVVVAMMMVMAARVMRERRRGGERENGWDYDALPEKVVGMIDRER